jgi:hypothetical protein
MPGVNRLLGVVRIQANRAPALQPIFDVLLRFAPLHVGHFEGVIRLALRLRFLTVLLAGVELRIGLLLALQGRAHRVQRAHRATTGEHRLLVDRVQFIEVLLWRLAHGDALPQRVVLAVGEPAEAGSLGKG